MKTFEEYLREASKYDLPNEPGVSQRNLAIQQMLNDHAKELTEAFNRIADLKAEILNLREL